MEEESLIYKSLEEEKTKEKEDHIFKEDLSPIHDNINFQFQNNESRLSKPASKAQIYHYEKTIHELSNKILDLNSQMENILLQLNKSKAVIDSHKTEIKILKEQLINQTNNNQNYMTQTRFYRIELTQTNYLQLMPKKK